MRGITQANDKRYTKGETITMRILIYGIGGTVGRVLFDTISKSNSDVCVAGVDKLLKENTFGVPVFTSCSDVNVAVDCIIDFSVHNAVFDYLPFAVKNKIPCVIATTGFNDEEMQLIKDSAMSIPILQSGNMSLGINLVLSLIRQAAAFLGEKADIEIIEKHHNRKADAPSGTALMLYNAVKNEDSYLVHGREGIVGKRTKNEIGMHAVRGGTIVGQHDVMFIMNNEVVTISHEADSKAIFAEGALKAAAFITEKESGLYAMKDLF